MVRALDHDARRREVLSNAIDTYILNATPVSSQELCHDFSCSSATIRNILAELEEDGYLTHPHTSAGRIPTDKGYRYYVDFLASQIELLQEEKNRIFTEYKKQITRLEDLLERTSEVLSAFSHSAAIISFSDWDDKLYYNGASFILEQPEFRDLEKTRQIIRVLEERHKLIEIINRDLEDKLKVYIGNELCCEEIQDCSLIVSSYKLKNKTSGRVALLGPKRMCYNKLIPTLEYISGLINELANQF